MTLSYGKMLKEIREKYKKTQGDIASLIGKTTMYISNIENEKNGPLKGNDLNTILDYLQVTEAERIKIQSVALLESKKMTEDLTLYFQSNPGLLELVLTLCVNKIDQNNVIVIEEYYERIIKGNVQDT